MQFPINHNRAATATRPPNTPAAAPAKFDGAAAFELEVEAADETAEESAEVMLATAADVFADEAPVVVALLEPVVDAAADADPVELPVLDAVDAQVTAVGRLSTPFASHNWWAKLTALF